MKTRQPTNVLQLKAPIIDIFLTVYQMTMWKQCDNDYLCIQKTLQFLSLFQKKNQKHSYWAVFMAIENEYSTNIPIYMPLCILRLTNTASHFHSLSHHPERVGLAIFAHIQKPVDFQVFQNVLKQVCVSLPTSNVAFFCMCVCVSIPALQTVGSATCRAHSKQARSHVLQTAVKTLNEMHILNVLCAVYYIQRMLLKPK